MLPFHFLFISFSSGYGDMRQLFDQTEDKLLLSVLFLMLVLSRTSWGETRRLVRRWTDGPGQRSGSQCVRGLHGNFSFVHFHSETRCLQGAVGWIAADYTPTREVDFSLLPPPHRLGIMTTPSDTWRSYRSTTRTTSRSPWIKLLPNFTRAVRRQSGI